ncbi:LOW QUALITY PROTEIN: RING-H2 finger protein ATL65 [Juglans microcarpa x Juglans regia]|uniref:LOW QUALITY PROTEIN: RING-H2 finger protein ATL65 n=1 Tax=Juglans microcarpa x Juglans regia TaxID=2249226 RepID=UPI001B7DF1AD|nr:LOW QUALITY PROTEIN: RING-H2 finger protein ATL65 [Juglans microcarpa x Juglans regia]
MMMVPAESPVHVYHPWAPSPPSTATTATAFLNQSMSPPPRLPLQFSPPLIAMVVVVAAAFIVVTYSRLISRHVVPSIIRIIRRCRQWRRRRGARSFLPSSSGDLDSLPYDSPFFEASDGFRVYSPYGLDESVIKTIPLSIYTSKSNRERRDCVVCLLEFEDGDYVRTLPFCSHAFHVDCIDIWLRSHANCPLCRAGIFCSESPFIPLMAARIRPSLDDTILRSMTLEPLTEALPESRSSVSEITPCIEEQSPTRNNNYNYNHNSEDRFNGRDFLLKRSYSFGFERSMTSERMVMEPATASPWRYRRGSFWNKRMSPFGSLTKPRVFSFRYYRGMKSPFFRRRGLFPLSESRVRFTGSGGVGGGGGGGGWSSRRSKSMTSPMFMRSSGMGAGAFSSSRLRCGDPEALLSPERFNGRR